MELVASARVYGPCNGHYSIEGHFHLQQTPFFGGHKNIRFIQFPRTRKKRQGHAAAFCWPSNNSIAFKALHWVRDCFQFQWLVSAAATFTLLSPFPTWTNFANVSRRNFPELVHPGLASIRTQTLSRQESQNFDITFGYPHNRHAEERFFKKIERQNFGALTADSEDSFGADMTIRRRALEFQLLQVPNPRRWNCWVSDQANVLTRSTVEHLNSVIDALKFDTGGEVTVVTIKSCGEFAARDFAAGLYERWKIEQEAQGRGVLFLLVASKKKLEVELGWSASKLLGADDLCSSSWIESIVGRKILSQIDEKHFDNAMVLAVEGVAEKIWESSGFGTSSPAIGKWWKVVDLVWMSFPLVLVLLYKQDKE